MMVMLCLVGLGIGKTLEGEELVSEAVPPPSLIPSLISTLCPVQHRHSPDLVSVIFIEVLVVMSGLRLAVFSAGIRAHFDPVDCIDA